MSDISNNVSLFPVRDNGQGKGQNNGGNPPTEPPMDLVERVTDLEKDMRDVRDRLARIEVKQNFQATREDLQKEITAQTWRLVTFVCGFGAALVAATYFIAKHV